MVYIKKYKNLSAEYYPENKAGVLKTTKKARERYQSFSKEEKEKKQQYGYERYKSLPEDEKQKIVEYRKNIEWERTLYYNYKKVFKFKNFCFFLRGKYKKLF